MLIYLFTSTNSWSIHQTFGVSNQNFKIWQIFTYMFLHGGIMHLFFNMFAVWMFGTQLENLWGSKRFLNYYLLTGLGAAILHFTIFNLFKFDSLIPPSGTKFSFLYNLRRLNFIIPKDPFLFL